MHQNSTLSPENLDDYRWLVGPQGRDWLETIRSTGEQLRDPLRLAARLRRDLPAERVHLLLTQADLRRRAEEKFPHAQRMFFTTKGLEQATDAWVAAYKANRFHKDCSRADLCCGIGGDLMALTVGANVRAVERDPIAGLLAEANLESVGAANNAADDHRGKSVTIEIADVTEIVQAELRGVEAWHIDPDRRATGRRTTRVELHEPGPNILIRLLTACPHAAIKLAPAATFTEPWWADAELEWIGRGRQCRQLVAWFGKLAEHPGQRRATVLQSCTDSDGKILGEARSIATSFIGTAQLECPVASRIGRYLFEPDPAVLAAKLENTLALEYDLTALEPGVAYFTGDILLKHAAVACFEVIEIMPYRATVLKSWLAQRGIGRIEVKKRGVSMEPEKIRLQLKVRGDEEATIILARIGGQITAIVARRIHAAR